MLSRDNKTAKECGILLSVTSLPSDYGIGTLGKEAFEFVDFLKKCGQSYWQILPLCPIGKGNSPYCSEGAFAGEILLIDIEKLINSGLLSDSDIGEYSFTKNTDYNDVREFKLPLLKKAVKNFNADDSDFKQFKRENAFWLQDFCLFSAIKESESTAEFYNWNDGLKYRRSEELEDFKASHHKEITFFEITQFLFYSQYKALKAYANSKGIKIIGDIPFYVSLNSADVWSNPDVFCLNRDMTPRLVAGVPPDIFSSEGQLWGNPIYDWEYLRLGGYSWWKKRLLHTAGLYDVIRIDHFRAFADYYTIKYGAKNATEGEWIIGEGMNFWNPVKPLLENTEIIAEDLGGETPEVEALVKDSGFPNMKVLQFAFDSDLSDPFLPHNMNENCVCYTGTHDNDTTLGWLEKATEKEKLLFSELVPKDKSGSDVLSLISFGMKSKARLVIIPLQDYLELDSDSRMNTPGTPLHNWEWRFKKGDLSQSLCDIIIRLSSYRSE